MINNIQELRERLFTSGIVKDEQELQGCTPEEIAYIKSKYGVLPITYRKILGLLGHSVGKLVRGSEFEFYFDQLIKMNGSKRLSLSPLLREKNVHLYLKMLSVSVLYMEIRGLLLPMDKMTVLFIF